MSSRRVLLSQMSMEDDKVVAEAQGMAGEEFTAEMYQMYGLSVNPKGDNESVLHEINGCPNNYLALPPCGYRQAKEGETLLYHGDTVISLTDDSITLVVGGNNFAIKDGKVTTDMDIETTGKIVASDVEASNDVTVGTISLRTHTHPTPAGQSGTPTGV